jgi:hypothetical protein
LHRILQSAYSFVKSIEVNKAVSNISLDGLLKDHIDSLQQGTKTQIVDAHGKPLGSRLSKWDQLDELSNQFAVIIKAIKAAGTNASKLNSLGIFETDQATVSSDTGSTSAMNNSGGAQAS